MDKDNTDKILERLDLFDDKMSEKFDFLDERIDHYKDRLEELEEEIQEIKNSKINELNLKFAKSSNKWAIIVGILVLIETVIGLILFFGGKGH